MNRLESYFAKFRQNIIGIDQTFESPFGRKKIIYADWIASGRLYKPIEEKMISDFGPFVANTHSESSTTGMIMTNAYKHAQKYIKAHVNANESDVIIAAGSGMTGVVNKFIRILGLRVPEQLKSFLSFPEELKPVIFISHIEHHSNQTSWLETLADVVIIPPEDDGSVSPENLKAELIKYKNRKLKIGTFSACSNVTGIHAPYHELAEIMHSEGGYCFVDFACSAPYMDIDMHPANPEQSLDAIFFSPHKFLGGPGTPGVLIFNSNLYHNQVPDHPGGGTVDWTNPWGQHRFVSNIEAREDGGTPPFLQTIKTALTLDLKEQMGTDNILKREEELVDIVFDKFPAIPKLHLLAGNITHRLGAISFYLEDIHYNLAVKLLNDRYGIQVRGGCSCAGTYGHFLLHVDPNRSKHITDLIDSGDLSEKPGWVRVSLHPTMTDDELFTIIEALNDIVRNYDTWAKDYHYSNHTNEFLHKDQKSNDFSISFNF